MYAWENRIAEWIQKRLFAIGVVLFFLISIVLRFALLPFRSSDFIDSLDVWFNTLKDAGGILAGMRLEIGDYNHLYRFLLALSSFSDNSLYVVKFWSNLFDYVGAAAGAWLVYTALREAGTEKRRAASVGCVAGLFLLYLPIVLMNSAVWGQCDFTYTSFLVLCIVFLIKEKYVPAFLCYGVAFSFKLQAIFLLPILILLYFLTRKFSFTHFLIVPGTMLVCGLPGIIARWPVVGAQAVLEPFLIYKKQILGYNTAFTLNFANIYSFMEWRAIPDGHIENFYKYVRLSGTIFALVVLGSALWYVLLKRPKMDARLLILLSLFSVDTCTLFLPDMHDRYAFCYVILLTLYVVTYRRLGRSLLLSYLVETCIYVHYLNENELSFSYAVLATFSLAAYVLICLELYRLVCAASDTAVGGAQKEERAKEPPVKRKRAAKRVK